MTNLHKSRITLPVPIVEECLTRSLSVENPITELGRVVVELAVECGDVFAPGEDGGAGFVLVTVVPGVVDGAGFWG